MDTSKNEALKKRLDRLAWFLDSTFRIPFTNFRFGLDALMGLLPGVGDVAGLVLSGVVIVRAAKLGAPKSVLFKMAGNVAIDSMVGVVPVVGDLFDFGFRSNKRNVDLLNAYLEKPQETTEASRWFVAKAILLVLGFVLAVALVMVGLLKFVMGMLA